MRKLKIVCFFIFILGASSHAQNMEYLEITGDHESCSETFSNQQKKAIRNMQRNAEIKCGRDVAIQISETILEETHSCAHYALGAQASAHFKCSTGLPEL
jgi:L-fucose isomerase-like protein